MATTTFCDVEFTDSIENFHYENKEYNFSEGDVVSIPRHTANKFVNKWGKAVYDRSPYEIPDEDYDAVLMRIRNKDEKEEGDDVEYCEAVKSNGEVCGREKPCGYHDE